MAELDARETEAREAYRRYVEQRDRCVAGEAPWTSIGEFFTDAAVFIDPAWGRAEGRTEIGRLMAHAMTGLEDWTFPEEWVVVEGDRVVAFWWNRLPGTKPDGTPNQAPAFSVLHYAGDGLFDYELDLVNMAEVGDLVVSSGWVPGPDMSFPGPNPDRDVTPRRLPTP